MVIRRKMLFLFLMIIAIIYPPYPVFSYESSITPSLIRGLLRAEVSDGKIIDLIDRRRISFKEIEDQQKLFQFLSIIQDHEGVLTRVEQEWALFNPYQTLPLWIICIDISGSIKKEKLIQSIRSLIDAINPGERIGVIFFGSEARYYKNFIIGNDEDGRRVQEELIRIIHSARNNDITFKNGSGTEVIVHREKTNFISLKDEISKNYTKLVTKMRRPNILILSDGKPDMDKERDAIEELRLLSISNFRELFQKSFKDNVIVPMVCLLVISPNSVDYENYEKEWNRIFNPYPYSAHFKCFNVTTDRASTFRSILEGLRNCKIIKFQTWPSLLTFSSGTIEITPLKLNYKPVFSEAKMAKITIKEVLPEHHILFQGGGPTKEVTLESIKEGRDHAEIELKFGTDKIIPDSWPCFQIKIHFDSLNEDSELETALFQKEITILFERKPTDSIKPLGELKEYEPLVTEKEILKGLKLPIFLSQLSSQDLRLPWYYHLPSDNRCPLEVDTEQTIVDNFGRYYIQVPPKARDWKYEFHFICRSSNNRSKKIFGGTIYLTWPGTEEKKLPISYHLFGPFKVEGSKIEFIYIVASRYNLIAAFLQRWIFRISFIFLFITGLFWVFKSLPNCLSLKFKHPNLAVFFIFLFARDQSQWRDKFPKTKSELNTLIILLLSLMITFSGFIKYLPKGAIWDGITNSFHSCYFFLLLEGWNLIGFGIFLGIIYIIWGKSEFVKKVILGIAILILFFLGFNLFPKTMIISAIIIIISKIIDYVFLNTRKSNSFTKRDLTNSLKKTERSLLR